MLSVNTQFGRYKICSALGAGGMGEVFLAEDTRLDRKVALKVLPEAVAQDNERIRRFVQEAKAASALNHPNILTIYEIGETDEGARFIASEYIKGATLGQQLKSRTFSVSEALEIGVQIAAALNSAHAAGIVHRDIKPENVMLRDDGLVKVLDFGLAKLLEKKPDVIESEDETRALVRTNPGVVMGTVAYMSPEQARGKETDARTDIFSFGVVLYEMLTGKQPFAGETVSDTIAAILKAAPEPVGNFNRETPAELERIVHKTLEKNSEERYQTAKDLLVDLRHLKKQIEIQTEFERTPNKTANENATQILAARPTSGAESISNQIKNHKLGFTVGAAILLLAAIGFGLGIWFFWNRPTKQIESIAVLPFENASGNADLDYLSDGVSESVIDRLSQLPQLKVIARSSSFRYRGQNLNLPEIANALGVSAIVTGRVVPRGDSYQIRVELVDVRENKQLWGESFTRKSSDIQILQTDISREIADNLRLRLSGTQTQQFAGQGTTNPQAYELLLKARFYFNKTGPENFHRAVEYWEQAIAADPNYALAYAELANGYNYGGRGLDRKESQRRREAAALKALELDLNLAEAHFVMARAKRDAWQWQEAEREYKRAIELNPNLAWARGGYAAYLSLMGRKDEALAEAKRALEINPLSLIISAELGSVHFQARRYDEAIEAFKKRIELEQNTPVPYRRLGDVYTAKGMYDEAIAAYRESIRLRNSNRFDREWIYLGAAYAKAGLRAEAEEILQKIKTTENEVSPTELAILYGAMGKRDDAFAQFEKAFSEREPNLPFIVVDPNFDNLRSDPRFQDLLRRMGLQPQ